MNAFEVIAVVLAGYFLGSLPFAVWVSRYYGVDILKEGSGNPGATNVRRTVSKGAGNAVFALDALKGWVAVSWPVLPFLQASYPMKLSLLGLIAAVVGHSFSVFLQFRGGRGVAVVIGGLLMVMPQTLFMGLGVWVLVFFGTRTVSLASLSFAASLPLSALLLGQPSCKVVVVLLLAFWMGMRHWANLRRLFRGEENRFEKEKHGR